MATPPEALYESNLGSLELAHRGKVRDIYTIDDERMLIVASDRISAFDVVLPDPIPGKGRVLTELSRFWFEKTRDIVPNHMLDTPLEEVLPDPGERAQVEGRAMVVRRLETLPMEAIVRGYLIGSGWKEYHDKGTVCGIELPGGLEKADRLNRPIFTPSTKAEAGDHDENISFHQLEKKLGPERAREVKETALELYGIASHYAEERGIIVADTKFEFGVDTDGTLYLIDEAITPDSSRFWPAESYRTGISPPSFDKQYVRDYLEELDWDKTDPGPNLPERVIEKTAEKYEKALSLLAK